MNGTVKEGRLGATGKTRRIGEEAQTRSIATIMRSTGSK
jgi:hypothetical protein